ncbi:Multiple coagulation factor deficiency protein 2-like [Oopsacas minuta]|uniref:Multiple coagulation factor deficiency protein 2-like n=1 Tax=Oopsacas minuta TaxID=111878 RepID=A0AAV7KB80_9METZ|nr:Multiple coagulation factor deficiency protein 2-like [Oopsacas minuta]
MPRFLSILSLLLLISISCLPVYLHQENFFHKPEQIQDKEHILEHARDFIDIQEDDLAEDEKVYFHYFKVHDLDLNHKLDGSELAKAMLHHEGSTSDETMSDTSIASIVDAILMDDDKNEDGYIDYKEFLVSQGKEI